MKNKYYVPEFVCARIIIFFVTSLVGVYIIFIDKSNYLCNSEGFGCPLCGMKTAIHHAIRFRFEQAYSSHPLVWLIFLIAFLFLADIVISFFVLHKKRLQR